MEANLELLALAETWDNGKPIRETTAADMPLAIDHFRYFAGAIRAQEGSISEIDHDTVAYHFHEPLGVVGQIIPWNFPMLMAVLEARAGAGRRQLRGAEARRADPGLDPGSACELIGDLLPPGVLNVVNGFGLEAGKPLASSNAHRQDRLHRRDDDRPADHAIRQPEPDSGDARTRRQVAQHLLRGRHRRGRRFLRQGDRRLRRCSR